MDPPSQAILDFRSKKNMLSSRVLWQVGEGPGEGLDPHPLMGASVHMDLVSMAYICLPISCSEEKTEASSSRHECTDQINEYLR